jgi:hypothetical protein
MTHSIRWLGSLVLAAAALVATGAAAQGSPAAPAAESRAPGDSAAAAGDTPPANAVAADSKADNFDRTPTDCVTLSNVRETVVIDDSTILFYMRGGAKVTYRNTLPHTCPNLAREDRFAYKTTINQLCNIDLITVLEQDAGGLRDGFTCGLGSFYPITFEEAELLRKEHDKPNSTRGAVKTKPAELPPAKSEAPSAAASEPAAPSEPAPAGEHASPSDPTPR